MRVPPTGETGKGASQLWVLTSYFRTRPAGCFLSLNDPNILLFMIFIEQWGYIATSVGLSRSLPSHSKYVFLFLFLVVVA